MATSTSQTILCYSGLLAQSSCGYCDTSGGKTPHQRRCSFYVRAEKLSAEDYQRLVDRGWRRSGTLLYKPHMRLTCCKQYTIRLDPAQFKPARDKRQCLNRWNRYILGEEYIKEAAKRYPKSKEEKKKQEHGFDLDETVHAAEYPKLLEKDVKKILPEPAHKYEVKLEPAGYTDEKFQLYKRYQIHVHHDEPAEVTKSGFKRFLCESPIPQVGDAGAPKPLGSFHQCHYLDGKLVAIGVLDLLPHCVSSVYLISDPDLEKWNLGKVTACREALMAKEMGYGWYYMGYYIHTCQKMRYKGEYHPTYMLDPATYNWHLLDANLKSSLEAHPLFSPDRPEISTSPDDPLEDMEEDEMLPPGSCRKTNMPGLMSEEELEEFGLGKVLIRIQGQVVPAEMLVGFAKKGSVVRGIFEDIVGTVGTEVARGMVLALQ